MLYMRSLMFLDEVIITDVN